MSFGSAAKSKRLECICLSLLIVLTGSSSLGQERPRSYSVLASAEVQTEPPRIVLVWPADPNATSYTVSRKRVFEKSWTALATLPGGATDFADTNVATATAYEYQIRKTSPRYTGYGYLCAGIAVPLVDDRGKAILIVANTHAAALAAELARFQQDLAGDGWTVLRHDVSPDDPVPGVKALLRQEYLADPERVRAGILFGDVPVPYSGAIAPDGHENHFGAWPADVYYAEMDGPWTDATINITKAERARNWNVPGDGKFDQSSPPSEVDLQLGRVDLSNMTAFSNKIPARSETDLLRQYLLKNHRFRHGLMPVQRRALICDNFFDKGTDPVAGSGWRNFSAFFGASNILETGWSNYFPVATSESFLWSFASGGGQYYTCTGVGSSDDFALEDPQVVFTMWLGSYFGDWDNESNFVRAPLGASSYTLTSSYSGFPQWLYHHMALGETIGYGARLTQNNRPRGLYPPFNPGTGQVHIALHGDPTLRLHPVAPPSGLTATLLPAGVRLTWQGSPESSLRGYHVYRAASASGPFRRLTGKSPLAQTAYADEPAPGTWTYMVRAVKLETSGSGTYLNASQGIFTSIELTNTPPGPALFELAIARRPERRALLRVTGPPGQRFSMESSLDLVEWTPLLTNALPQGSFEQVVRIAPEPQRFYRAVSNE